MRLGFLPFTTLNSILNHVDAITLKRQNGPICEIGTHKTVILASVLRLTRAHSPLNSTRWKCKLPLCTFPESMTLRKHITYSSKEW